jgi:hypothetical protein
MDNHSLTMFVKIEAANRRRCTDPKLDKRITFRNHGAKGKDRWLVREQQVLADFVAEYVTSEEN